MSKSEVIEALADYFKLDVPSNIDCDGDWISGATILGNDGEYRWMTLANIIEALDRAWLLDDDDDDDWDD